MNWITSILSAIHQKAKNISLFSQHLSDLADFQVPSPPRIMLASTYDLGLRLGLTLTATDALLDSHFPTGRYNESRFVFGRPFLHVSMLLFAFVTLSNEVLLVGKES
jgi:hypothetical protein